MRGLLFYTMSWQSMIILYIKHAVSDALGSSFCFLLKESSWGMIKLFIIPACFYHFVSSIVPIFGVWGWASGSSCDVTQSILFVLLYENWRQVAWRHESISMHVKKLINLLLPVSKMSCIPPVYVCHAPARVSRRATVLLFLCFVNEYWI